MKTSYFETHVGFPEGQTASFNSLMASEAVWSELNFEKIVRAANSDRYDAHDVPGGIRHLATVNCSSFPEAIQVAQDARKLVGQNPLARVEIEEVLAVNDENFSYSDQVPILSNNLGNQFSLISDFPSFESHISVKHPDNSSITDIGLEEKLVEAGFCFNEYAVTRAGQKGIFTMFYDAAIPMFEETRNAALALKKKLPADVIVKASMERILFCASFG